MCGPQSKGGMKKASKKKKADTDTWKSAAESRQSFRSEGEEAKCETRV